MTPALSQLAGVGALIRGTCGPSLIERVAQNVRFSVGRDCNVGWLIERQDPTVDLLIVGAPVGLLDEHLVEAAQERLVADTVIPTVGRIEHVLLELRLQAGELQHHLLEALLVGGGESDAGEPEVAQRVLEHSALHGVERSALALLDGAVSAVERLALGKIRLVRREERQAGVVRRAQRLGVEHRVEMAHRRPDACDPVLQLLQRLHHRRERQSIVGRDLLDPASARVTAPRELPARRAPGECGEREAAARGRAGDCPSRTYAIGPVILPAKMAHGRI